MADKPEDIGIESKTPAERDRTDLNHEMAGLNTGRQIRFLSGDSHAFSSESKKKKAEREFRTLLDMLLAEDAQYAALYYEVLEKIEMAQQAVDSALVDISQRLEASARKLQLLRENAAELPDGTKVFRSNNGSIYNEHGKRISDDRARDITFPKGAPNWETYKAEKEGYATAVRQKEEVDVYQKTVLDPTTKQIKDKKNPRSRDELEKIHERSIEDKMPEIIRKNFYSKDDAKNTVEISSISNAHKQVEKTNLTVPNIGKSFDQARTDIPNLDDLLGAKLTPPKIFT